MNCGGFLQALPCRAISSSSLQTTDDNTHTLTHTYTTMQHPRTNDCILFLLKPVTLTANMPVGQQLVLATATATALISVVAALSGGSGAGVI